MQYDECNVPRSTTKQFRMEFFGNHIRARFRRMNELSFTVFMSFGFEDYFNIFYLIEVTCSFDYYCYYWLTRIYFRNMQFPIEVFATLLFMTIYSPYASASAAAAARLTNLFHFYRTQTYNMNAIFAIDNCFSLFLRQFLSSILSVYFNSIQSIRCTYMYVTHEFYTANKAD